MKFKINFYVLVLVLLTLGCSGTIEFSDEFKKETAGKYQYNEDELILVYYKDDKLMLNWKEGVFQPVVTDSNEIFVADMYKKLRFVKKPGTAERYLSIVSEENPDSVSYDYLKVPDSYKTPSTHLKEGNYEEALAGFLKIKEKDSTSSYIREWDFNRKGYTQMREKEYDKAIEIFKLNLALHPTSANVYDSLADAYLKSGDSLNAYINYKEAYKRNSDNKRALKYVNAYKSKDSIQ
ncbi:tetratricopeptide repeat protein [Winogradskyella alexanderae]|uniref:Tetratricopeptide repeat protein n=1 Tax=Winogradskyella alexanderae TaxID=2877123 RepID=A0ABS7XSX4_9FLAO|nr:tetratricopeptide repeat protein [Winogradskyella alexanderae]MCA0131951.1 tetratricopeptide repeat protein [Winogradskyella alexanderae]